jgi:iron complex outermembrane receptor protein
LGFWGEETMRLIAALVASIGLAAISPAGAENVTDSAAAPPGVAPTTISSPDNGAKENASSDENELKEVVVTAARQRSESVQEAPVTVSVLTPHVIESLQGSSITSLSAVVPNLLIVPSSGNYWGLPVISLRGFSSDSSDISNEPAVAVYIDGVYQTIQPGSFADLFDLDSLEVLRGPQGTLLGKNAPAGAIMLNRSRPTGEDSVDVKVETGSYNLLQGQALMNVAIIPDILSAKMYVFDRHRDGYIDDTYLGREEGGEKHGTIRAALLFTPASGLSFYWTNEYNYNRDQQDPQTSISGPGTAACSVFHYCAVGPAQINTTQAAFVAGDQIDDYASTLVADWALAPVALKSITGYRNLRSVNNSDVSGLPIDVVVSDDDIINLTSISEEFRVNSVKDGGMDIGGRLNWVAGAYFAHSNAYATQPLAAFEFASVTSQAQIAIRDNYAVFAHSDLEILDSWKVSFGVRRSDDRIDHRFSLSQPSTFPNPINPYPDNRQTASFQNTSYEAGTQYKFTPDKMVFFRYSEGYRAGGFNGFPTSTDNPAYLPETSKSYEVGLKSDWLDHRFRANLTIFDGKYSNLQVTAITNSAVGLAQVVANAQATTKGVELEVVAVPIDALTLRASFGYLDAKYTQFLEPLGNGSTEDATGEQIPFTSKYTGSLSTDYKMGVQAAHIRFLDNIVLHGAVDTRSSLVASNNSLPEGIQGGYTNINTSVMFNSPHDKSTFTVYVNDIADKHWKTVVDIIPGLSTTEAYNIGRIWGASWQSKF